MILSHHGKLEFGSPKVPLFPEALLLHYLDDMDSKMECMRATADKGAMAEGLFTAWSPSLERVVLRKERYLANGNAGGQNFLAPEAPAERAVEKPAADDDALLAGSSVPGSGFGDKLRTALGTVELRSRENG
jgi:3'-5' exoribonuclease